MERFRAEPYFRAAKETAMQKSKEGKELESDKLVLEAAYKKAIETETDQIQMDDFEGVYGIDIVAKHRKDAESLGRIFEKQKQHPEFAEGYRLGKILEAIVTEQIELNEWLGPNVDTQQTTDYDDYINGIDFVAEFNEEGALRHMGFAIDATYGKKEVIRLKLEKIRSQLHRGELGEVQYFQTVDKTIQGKKRLIPKVVLAIDKGLVVDLARAWVKGEQKALAHHPVKEMIMIEILDQLEGQLNYARALERRNHPGSENLVRPLMAQTEAMRRIYQKLFPDSTRLQTRFDDAGSRGVYYATKAVFDPKNAGNIEEAELKLKIKKRKKVGKDVSGLKNELKQMMSPAEVETQADKIPVSESVKQQQTVESPHRAPTRKELNDRYQFLLQQQKTGNNTKAVKAEIAFLQGQFRRLNQINKMKSVIEKRAKPQNPAV